jgi:hypothetical protein
MSHCPSVCGLSQFGFTQFLPPGPYFSGATESCGSPAMTGSFPDGCRAPGGFADGLREEGEHMRTPALTVLSCCVVVALAAIASLAQTTPDFPMWCRGTAGMASSSGKNLIIDFTPSNKRAPDGLAPGNAPGSIDRSVPTNPHASSLSNSQSQRQNRLPARSTEEPTGHSGFSMSGDFSREQPRAEGNKGASRATFDRRSWKSCTAAVSLLWWGSCVSVPLARRLHQ